MEIKRIRAFLPFIGFFLACLFGVGTFVYTGYAIAADMGQSIGGGAPATAFAISDIGVSALNSKSVLIRWTTAVLANSQVEYGLNESYGNRSDLDLTQVFSHAVKLSDLKPGLIYFFRVLSADAVGNRIVSQRFVFVPLRGISRSETTETPINPPVLSFTAPLSHEILKDQSVAFTYQINGDWPAADRSPHAYLWTDELRNGTWIERTQAFDIGSQANAALRSGSFSRSFAPGTYRINGMLAAYQPKHEMLRGSSVTPLVFTVWDASSTDITISSSFLLPSSGPKFKSGDRIRNWRAADVRQTPLKSNSLIGVQTPDTKGTIMGSPETVAGSRWWNINYDVGYDGWTQEESLLPIHAPVFDFELVAVDDGDIVATQGSSATFSFGGRLTSGMGQSVVFSATGIPADAYGFFSPASCTLPCLTTLRVSTLRTAPVGTYPITVSAISAKKEKKLPLTIKINKFSPAPSVSLSAPFLDSVVPGSSVTLASTVFGDTDLSGTRTIHFSLDGTKESIDTHLNAPHVFANLITGAHVLTGYLAGDRESKILGSDFSLAFMSDASLPVISGLESQHVTDASAVIVWNTDKNSTARVAYDSINDLRFSTKEDTTGLQQNHTVRLDSLLSCANYAYRAYSKNGAGAEGMSLAQRFATTGCLASMLPAVHAEGVISGLSQNTLTLVRDDRPVRVALPLEIPASASVQINGLDPVGVESGTPPPTSQSRLVGGHAYRVLVLKDPSASIFASDKPFAIAMRYLPEDVKDIVPGTLKIWRWTGADWTDTTQCRTDEDIREVSCTTKEISTFALFGVSSKLSVGLLSGALMRVGQSMPAPSMKTTNDLPESTPMILPKAASTAATLKISSASGQKKVRTSKIPSAPPAPLQLSAADAHTLTRDLYRGIKNSEVKLLQQFLISRTYLDAGSTTGFFDSATEIAVKKFQCDQEIVCQGTTSTTGFGSIDAQTRDKINPLLK